MAYVTSHIRRRIARLSLPAIVALASLAVPANQAAQAATGPTCFGHPATIVGFGKITGTEGDDVIVGSPIADTIDGRGGNDLICGIRDSSANIDEGDTILGGAGDDQIHGYGGDDVLKGGAGSDIILGDAGNDTILGGSGNDTLFGGDAVSVGDAGVDMLDGGKNVDKCFGEKEKNCELDP